MADLRSRFGGMPLKNPIVAASSEFTMTAEGIRACIDAGAGAVIAKSINESPAAARQLNIADYAVYRSDLSRGRWGDADSPTLFNRSGLAQTTVEAWVSMLATAQAHAASRGSHVIGSITVASAEGARDLACRMAEVVPAIELNIGAPHGREGRAVRQLTAADDVSRYVHVVRDSLDCPLIVKLPSQSSDLIGMARAAVDAGADAVTLLGRLNGFIPNIDTLEPELGSWGAIGGPWMLPISLYWVSKCRRALGPDAEIIGTNGARDGRDILRFVLSGACAVEVASAVLQHGPQAITDAIEQLSGLLDERGLATLAEIVGHTTDLAQEYGEISDIVPPSRPWI